MRLLGIPTFVDRLLQQAINQVLTPIYENQFWICQERAETERKHTRLGQLLLPCQYETPLA